MAQRNVSGKCPKCNRVFTGVGASVDRSSEITLFSAVKIPLLVQRNRLF